ncbi:SDR family NAD(P)-dependent oxidoreductase [Celeribacter baekdonensis]|uniref:C factor, cell signaling protein n=1 Tax=Celeribacter baekdonensis TaxID=875171 RepID=A0A2R4M429_9RHOB|nr:SDR family NAD(P)-dependent oxidoreductase [Celeribacter baekdonensis]AVW91960.1 C factor, cell signaling protein [Celeribacter baekdonensis]
MFKHALILGASGGIGGALAALLTAQDTPVTALSRSRDGFDVTDPASVAHHLGAFKGPFDLIILATGKLDGAGLPPEKSLKVLSAEAMADQFATNAIGPALVLRELPRLLPKDAPSTVAVLTARVGSISDNHLGGWYSYRAAKAAANQVIRTAAIEMARSHKQACLIAYHPGTVASEFTKDYARDKLSPEGAAAQCLDLMSRLSAAQTGRFYDWKGDEVPW